MSSVNLRGAFKLENIGYVWKLYKNARILHDMHLPEKEQNAIILHDICPKNNFPDFFLGGHVFWAKGARRVPWIPHTPTAGTCRRIWESGTQKFQYTDHPGSFLPTGKLMGKLQSFTIEFESPHGVCHAGQSVTGAVCIQLSDSTDLTGEWPWVTRIYLHFYILVSEKVQTFKMAWKS